MEPYDIVKYGQELVKHPSFLRTDDAGHIYVGDLGEGPSLHYDPDRKLYVLMAFVDGGLFAGGTLISAELLEEMRR
jgi:hypothetical protein